MAAQREPDLFVVGRELARTAQERQRVGPAAQTVERVGLKEKRLRVARCERGGAREGALGLFELALSEDDAAEVELRERPVGSEAQRLFEARSRVRQLPSCQTQRSDVVM